MLFRRWVIYTGTEPSKDTKDDSFENEYEVADLKVSKEISGNLANPELVFTIVIALTSENNVNSAISIEGSATASEESIGWTSNTITATLKGGESVTISNIPVGVKYTVTETKAGTENIEKIEDNQQIAKANVAAAYKVENEVTTATALTSDGAEVTVKNTKTIEVPNGISVDFVPYVLIIALAGIALVAMKARKKEN